MRRPILSLVFLLLFAAAAPADTYTIAFTVSAGKHDRAAEPVCIPVRLPAGVVLINKVEIRDAKDQPVADGQISSAGLRMEQGGKDRKELHFVLPALAAGKSLELKAVIVHGGSAAPSGFGWKNGDELRFGDRPI